MSIKARLHPILQHLAGGQEVIEVTGHTTGECLENLESRFPGIKQQIRDKRGQLRSYCCILVNSESIYPKELTTPVKDGDQIDIVIFVAGG
ncbi:MAG: MoaD/ThiS family protein [Dehalococcoidia bacterium]|nr:MoaD/ThiS family protein [Dehalococcoidia bacterium]